VTGHATYHKDGVSLADLIRATRDYSVLHGDEALRVLLTRIAGVKVSTHVPHHLRRKVMVAVKG
jgi:hypothetical protein